MWASTGGQHALGTRIFYLSFRESSRIPWKLRLWLCHYTGRAIPLYRQSYFVIPAELFHLTGRDTPFNRQSYSVPLTWLVKLHLLVKRGSVWRVKLNKRQETSSKFVSAMKRLTYGKETFGICSQVYISSLQFLQIPHTEMKHNRTRAEHVDSLDSQELRYWIKHPLILIEIKVRQYWQGTASRLKMLFWILNCFQTKPHI